jgi:hypothetical protein
VERPPPRAILDDLSLALDSSVVDVQFSSAGRAAKAYTPPTIHFASIFALPLVADSAAFQWGP